MKGSTDVVVSGENLIGTKVRLRKALTPQDPEVHPFEDLIKTQSYMNSGAFKHVLKSSGPRATPLVRVRDKITYQDPELPTPL